MIFKKRKKEIESEPQPIVGMNVYGNPEPGVTTVKTYTLDTYHVRTIILKSCPYCGGKLTTEIAGALCAEITIRCSKCGASVHVRCDDEPPTFSEATDAMLESANKWNARAAQQEKKDE